MGLITCLVIIMLVGILVDTIVVVYVQMSILVEHSVKWNILSFSTCGHLFGWILVVDLHVGILVVVIETLFEWNSCCGYQRSICYIS